MTEHTEEYLKNRASVIAAAFARKNLLRKAKVLKDGISFIEGDHTPMSWRVDGNDLIVVLTSGPKLIEPVKGPTVIDRIKDAVTTAFEEQQAADERHRLLDEREADLLRREAELQAKAAELQTQQANTINPSDGIDEAEASAAGKALQAKKTEKK